MPIADWARLARSHLETRTRPDGSTFVTTRDGSPEWMGELVREAHGSMLPDDVRYTMIRDALDWLEEDNDPDEYDPEPDIYARDLCAWLASHVDRYAYCDEAMEEHGAQSSSILDMIRIGQAWEMREVMASVVASLAEVGDDVDNDDEGT